MAEEKLETCPNCGYCPTCGRARAASWPVYPGTAPYPQWVPYWGTITVGTGGTSYPPNTTSSMPTNVMYSMS